MRALNTSRIVAVGLVFAIAGFCYALSSAPNAGANTGASSRAVGTNLPLRFTNPFVTATTEYDLGDASFGSAVTRYITAEGGLRPYRFTSDSPNGLSRAIQGTLSSLQLGLSGVLAGTAPMSVAAGNPLHTTALGTPGLRFEVGVSDSRGTSSSTQTGFFNLFLFDPLTTPFRFAMDKLPDARLGLSYVTKVDVVGGRAPFTFTLLSISGAGVSTPEDLGIFVTPDGSIIGTPLREGTFILVVSAKDALGVTAAGRNGAGSSQAFVLNVLANTVVSSDVMTLACSVRGDRSSTLRDTLKYTGVVNAQGQDLSALASSAFSLRVGNLVASGSLSTAGTVRQRLSDGSELQAKLNLQTGVLSVKIARGSFATALNASALVDGRLTRKPVQITLGDAVVSSEVLDFETSVNGSRYGLNYRLGREGVSAAGGFLLTRAQGKDGLGTGGLPGDAWKIQFLALPRASTVAGQSTTLSNITRVNVRIGVRFEQALSGAGFISTGDRTRFGGGMATTVRSFKYSAFQGRGQLITNVISFASTGIPQAQSSVSQTNIFFPLGLDFTRSAGVFTGESSRRIFAFGPQYKDAPPRGR